MSTEYQSVPQPAWQERLKACAAAGLALASSRGIALLNLLLAAATVVLVLTTERSVLTGLFILAWGAAASYFAYRAGVSQQPYASNRRVVLAYAGCTLLLYILLNGLYRLTGI